MSIELKPLELNPPLNVIRVNGNEDLYKLEKFFAECGNEIGFDMETSLVKDFYYRRIRLLQFGTKDEQVVIDLLGFCDNDPDVLYHSQGHYGIAIKAHKLAKLIEILRPVLCTANITKVGVNLSFEYENLYWLLGLRAFGFYCCSVVERVIWAGLHSLKDYGFFSMEDMMARYFNVQIDKTLQTSFNLTDPISDEQVDYAALDTRTPLGIMAMQKFIIQGYTVDKLRAAGAIGVAKKFEDAIQGEGLPSILLGDDLQETARIENDAIGAFKDMHVHGERIDTERWSKRTDSRIVRYYEVIKKLDHLFLPYVGTKLDIITDEEIDEAERKWKALNAYSREEIKFKAQIRFALKDGATATAEAMERQMKELEAKRKAEKERLKAEHSNLRKKRTKIKNLAMKCKGDALINYDSGAQLLAVLNQMKGLKSLEDTSDDTLEKYEHIPVMALLRELRGLSKEIGTYGKSWTQTWTTKPCKEEGWLHPGDGRLHCEFNQQDAETGRSTSSKPNGQNLPQDTSYRECFVADPPDESIRISNCCESECQYLPGINARYMHRCLACAEWCDTHAEEYVLITADMSGAELRIIAELAKDPVWIGAFERGEDVHSVGTEILHPEEWPKGTLKSILKPEGWTLKDCKEEVVLVEVGSDGKEKKYGPCAYYALKEDGTYARQKCKCPIHNELRNDNKSTNFLLAYGGGPHTLAKRIKKALHVASELMAKHEASFPKIWEYLKNAGLEAKAKKKAFDMYGRRRILADPTWEAATERAKEDREEKLQYPDDVQVENIKLFMAKYGRKPEGGLTEIGSELYNITHREPSAKEIGSAFKSMFGSIERQGKNHGIQGTNASAIKKAMGCGYDPDGNPYLWHILPQYNAKLLKLVHDELVIQAPKRFAKKLAAEVQSAFRRAAAEVMKRVVMESEFKIMPYWAK